MECAEHEDGGIRAGDDDEDSHDVHRGIDIPRRHDPMVEY